MGNRNLLKSIAWLLFFCVTASLLMQVDFASAQSSLGIGRSEQAIRPEGMFAGILIWIQEKQQLFYQAMRESLIAIRNDDRSLWVLVGLSFGYGVFHAAGPGHGKAVISSYMLANEVALKRGVILSFAASFMQGLTAIVTMAALIFVLRGAGLRTDMAAGALEIASYLFVTLFGAWLLWSKITGRGGHHHHGHDHDHDHNHDDDHLHAPDPQKLTGDMGVRDAWLAILSVGVRPCTGAIIVLTFAFLNGLYLSGVLSVLAMSFGTGITVSMLAFLAVSAKNVAMRVAVMQDRAIIVHRTIEIIGALLVFLIGLLLLLAAWQA